MFKVIDLNDTGKTKKLLAECAEKNGLFICKHPERVSEKCTIYGIPQVETYGYDQWRSVVRLNKDDNCLNNAKDVYIDELEKFVSYVVPHLVGFSMTVDEK